VDTVRILAADAVEKVGNGHPGTAMSLAPAAYLLFQKLMRHDPSDPEWTGRDRFVLSPGHTSLTLYIQLFLSGYGLELDDLKALRTWGSLTPGHPEYRHTKGVEITTGPGPRDVGRFRLRPAPPARDVRRRRTGRHQPVRPHHLGHRLGR
jgi:transketolase